MTRVSPPFRDSETQFLLSWDVATSMPDPQRYHNGERGSMKIASYLSSSLLILEVTHITLTNM